ncbi:MAG: hypothetical protein EA382_01000 [Spirochaetaceae bacterium]|nr:MAG: hypothetical protein EA382_01000 [Spirochaetaceae bacterium]
MIALGACVNGPGGTAGDGPPSHERPYPTHESVPAEDALGVVWTEVPGNPLIPLPDCPAWNCLGMTDPWVERDADGDLLMWFSTGGDLGGPLVGRARVSAGLSAVLDPSDAPVLTIEEGVWDRYRETVSLRLDDDGEAWTMWYLGYSVSFFDDPAIGQMRSADSAGTDWIRADSPIYTPDPDGWDFAFITGPTFVEAPDGQWRIYYTGAGTTVGIGLLTSDDEGGTWTPYPGNPVFERDLASWDQGLFEPSIRHIGGPEGRYMMWYAGYEEPLDLESTPIYIGLATSADGIAWERSEYNPVLGPAAPGAWNDLRVTSPHVVEDEDGSLLMFVHAQDMGSIGRSMGLLGVWRSATP